MGDVRDPTPVLLLIAASSRHEAALAWGLRQSETEFGSAAAVSDAFDFTETDYYDAEMGLGLKKQFWVFAEPIDPSRLAAIKRRTNEWEAEYAGLKTHAEPRPLNLDPATSPLPSSCSPPRRTTPTASTSPTASTPR